jgi:hypothetical protein
MSCQSVVRKILNDTVLGSFVRYLSRNLSTWQLAVSTLFKDLIHSIGAFSSSETNSPIFMLELPLFEAPHPMHSLFLWFRLRQLQQPFTIISLKSVLVVKPTTQLPIPSTRIT